MMTFFFYLIVSFVEMILWIVYMTGEFEAARWYFSYIGYWGSIIAYALPMIFALIQMAT